MIQRVSSDRVLLFSTYAYLHSVFKRKPDFEKPHRERVTEAGYVESEGEIAPYLDIYALAVITLELLTGSTRLPSPLDMPTMIAHLVGRNPVVAEYDRATQERLAGLLLEMLSVTERHSMGADQVQRLANDLVGEFAETEKLVFSDNGGSWDIDSDRGVVDSIDSDKDTLRRLLGELRSTSRRLEAVTARMIWSSNELAILPFSGEHETLSQMDEAFATARKRTKTAWALGLVMTIAAFCLVAGMIVCAVVMAIIAAEPGWSLLFGGASVTTVIGTLLWKPYNKLFSATILAQQIEMIHIQTSVAMGGTQDVERRLDIIGDALNRLQALLLLHNK